VEPVAQQEAAMAAAEPVAQQEAVVAAAEPCPLGPVAPLMARPR
jgi:hypothetical protein